MSTEDKMTIDERRKYPRRMKRRYVQASRKEQGRLLDEMEAVTELHPRPNPRRQSALRQSVTLSFNLTLPVLVRLGPGGRLTPLRGAIKVTPRGHFVHLINKKVWGAKTYVEGDVWRKLPSALGRHH